MLQNRKGNGNVDWAQLATILVFGLLLPVLLFTYWHAMAVVILCGAITWAISQPVKGTLYVLASRWVKERLPTAGWAAFRGIISAVSELSVAAVYLAFFLPVPSISNLVGFGVGASSAEVLFLWVVQQLKRRRLRRSGQESRNPSGSTHYIFLAERSAALLLHVGSRCLLYPSIFLPNPWLGIWAIVSFSLVDGAAAYGKLHHWNWLDFGVYFKFWGFIVTVGAFDLCLFALTTRAFH